MRRLRCSVRKPRIALASSISMRGCGSRPAFSAKRRQSLTHRSRSSCFVTSMARSSERGRYERRKRRDGPLPKAARLPLPGTRPFTPMGSQFRRGSWREVGVWRRWLRPLQRVAFAVRPRPHAMGSPSRWIATGRRPCTVFLSWAARQVSRSHKVDAISGMNVSSFTATSRPGAGLRPRAPREDAFALLGASPLRPEALGRKRERSQ
jgi:hypothetical protein